MSHFVIATVVFVCVFGSALIGLYLRAKLPARHLTDESISVVKQATGLIATMAALVLGLLVSSAKTSFDTANGAVIANAAIIVRFDRVLARYGPDTAEIRALLRRNYAGAVQLIASGDPAQLSRLESPQVIDQSEAFERKVEELVPHGDTQVRLKAYALQIVDQVYASRWLILLQAKGSIPTALLIVLIAWLSLIFGTFGLVAPRNATIIATFFVCALSVSAAIFLIEEMGTPLTSIVRVSIAPMRDTLSRLGQ